MCRKIRYDEKFKKKLQNFWEVNKAEVLESRGFNWGIEAMYIFI